MSAVLTVLLLCVTAACSARSRHLGATELPMIVGRPGIGTQELFVVTPNGTVRRPIALHAAQAASPIWGPSGQVLFTSVVPGYDYYDTWSVDPKTRLARLLVAKSTSPSFSPRGNLIALNGNSRLTIAKPDGKIVGRLRIALGFADPTSSPAWSADGRRLAAWVIDRRGFGGIFVGRPGETWRRVTRKPFKSEIDHETDAYWDITWSPDGRRLAFWVGYFDEGTGPSLRLVNSNGGGERRIAKGILPAWSPNGRMLAYSATRSSGAGRGVYVVRADGAGRQFVANPPGEEIALAWSSDGTRIAIASGDDSHNHITLYVARPGTRGFRRLHTQELRQLAPLRGQESWARDGRGFAYDALHKGNSVVDVINADGRRSQITDPATDAYATWSPDRTAIAFTQLSGIQGGTLSSAQKDVFVFDTRGGGKRRIATGWRPTWSPDSKMLAFERKSAIFVVDRHGGKPRPIGRGKTPRWSPDGKQIAYLDSKNRIAVTDIGGGATRIVGIPPPKGLACDFGQDVSGPSWSPDGSEIAFGVSDCNEQTYIVDAASGNARFAGRGSRPVWSPDGDHIAVVADSDLVVMRPDGSGRLDVGPFDYTFGTFSWSPDGTRIAFDRYEHGKSSVAVATIDGGNVRVLPGHWRRPAWATLPSPPALEDDLGP